MEKMNTQIPCFPYTTATLCSVNGSFLLTEFCMSLWAMPKESYAAASNTLTDYYLQLVASVHK